MADIKSACTVERSAMYVLRSTRFGYFYKWLQTKAGHLCIIGVDSSNEKSPVLLYKILCNLSHSLVHH